MRPITAAEIPLFAEQLTQTFQGRSAPPEFVERRREQFELDRSLAVFEEGRLVGTAGAYSYEMTVPGGILPTAGVTMVTVAPTHRRQGILRALMRRQLDDIRERGEPLAALYASEAAIYGRFGYGLASYHASLRIARARGAFAAPFEDPGRLTLADSETALRECPPVYESLLARQPGLLLVSDAMWRHRFDDLEIFRGGMSEQYNVLHQTGGRTDGYVLLRKRLEWAHDGPGGTLRVLQLVAAEPSAYAALWRFCLDYDLMAEVVADGRPLSEPLRLLLADPRALETRLADGVWLRLVEVPAALAGRTYAAEGSLVLAVRDEFCGWNEGVYRLEGGPAGAECRRTSEAADLAAAYLGGNSFATLAGAGCVGELREGALSRADAMFRTELPPWTPTHF